MTATLDDYALEDRYRRQSGRVFLTGSQALVRLPLLQAERDRAAGLKTAGFIAGYRGSPLGGYDDALWKAADHLAAHDIKFLPAINEDLAATACQGTQQVESDPARKAEGVFAIWYGKGPGVDRSGDALKHGNMYGSSPHGGVLAIAGDDHGCVSSSFSHQSDEAFIAFGMPVIHPADIGEYLSFGLWGWAASRFSGCWIGFKAISETVEGAASVELPGPAEYAIPDDVAPPPEGLHNRWPDMPGPQIEARLPHKLAALAAFARANPLDRDIVRGRAPKLGIVTVGKAHHDVMDALEVLGIDEARAAEAGIAIRKLGLVWPIESAGMEAFAEGLDEILVVEEKHGVVEPQLRALFYNRPDDARPRILGKSDTEGRALVPAYEELRPHKLMAPLAARIAAVRGLDVSEAAARASALDHDVTAPDWVRRMPYFCAGCPHNTSTKLPEGSRAYAGIGCHFMASWMDRETAHLTQMGGEGVNWAGHAPFTDTPHMFQNLGDGTYYHSGSMAIRQAVAAGANITYKILFNDAVAMTGGQPVDGPLSVGAIVRQLLADGVQRVEVVGDPNDALESDLDLPAGYRMRQREDMDAVQRELREVTGVTALVYVQTCAAEKRRRRKRKTYPDPDRRIVINRDVCEGCGDCSKQSNCVAVTPVDTAWGTKRQIDQYACNKDYSCLKGFCPSFVEIEGAGLRKEGLGPEDDRLAELVTGIPAPALPEVTPGEGWQLLVTGIGGTGVVTIGAIVTMAAHLEGKGASVLDFTGFAQKGGSVMSHIKLSPDARAHPVRVDRGRADALVACDTVVATNPEMLGTIRPGRTRVVANAAEVATGQFALDRDARVRGDLLIDKLKRAAGADAVSVVDAQRLAVRLCGDAIATNMLMLGYAWQAGLVPVSEAALMRAIELNGVAIGANRRAFAFGRLAAAAPETLHSYLGEDEPDLPRTLDEIKSHRADFLTRYQNAAWARRYLDFVEKVETAEAKVAARDERPLALAVARNLAKLMAYKDEYEVARLYAESGFFDRLERDFARKDKLSVYLAPPVLNFGKDAEGRPKKRKFGPWIFSAFRLLARMKAVRGTPLDPFGWMAERRAERALIADYRATVEELLARLDADSHADAVAIAALPDDIRGFGPVKDAAIERYYAEKNKRLKALGQMAEVQAA